MFLPSARFSVRVSFDPKTLEKQVLVKPDEDAVVNFSLSEK